MEVVVGWEYIYWVNVGLLFIIVFGLCFCLAGSSFYKTSTSDS